MSALPYEDLEFLEREIKANLAAPNAETERTRATASERGAVMADPMLKCLTMLGVRGAHAATDT
jgi:hypothetical protein